MSIFSLLRCAPQIEQLNIEVTLDASLQVTFKIPSQHRTLLFFLVDWPIVKL